MALPVYSTQFILNNAATGSSSFAVPEGYTAVVRDFSVFTADGLETVQLLVQDSGAAPGVVVASGGSILPLGYYQWQGRVVVPAGGIISYQFAVTFANPDVYCGGYLLVIAGTR